MRIGLVHRSNRIDTWARYVVWILRLHYRQHEVVACCEDIGPDMWRWRKPDCDVYLRMDDSLNYPTPEDYHPLIYWSSDTHVPDDVDREAIANKADYAFCCQTEALTADGPYEEWLPHAAYFFPERAERPRNTISAAMVLAAKNPIFAKRTQAADRLRRTFAGTRIGPGIFHADMARLYADSAVVWHESVGDDLAIRHFEGSAAGACVLCNKINNEGYRKIFNDTMVTYESEDEMVDKAQYLLDHPKEREERGAALRTIVDQEHTYHHRVERILDAAEALTS